MPPYRLVFGWWHLYAHFRERRKNMEKATLSVRDLSEKLGISLPKAYELVKQPGFPVLKIGSRVLIPVDAFREWLCTNSAHE